MSDDYISREAALDSVCADCSDKMHRLCAAEENRCTPYKAVRETPAADVRPVKLINAGIETALQILDGFNEEGWLPYPVYSELHDAISVIGEYAQTGANMREDAT